MSPILFNMVLDELVEELEASGRGLKVSEHLYIACLAYADDLVMVSSTSEGCRGQLRRAEAFFDRRGLSLNVSKSRSLTVKIVPGRKMHYVSTGAKYFVGEKPLKVLGPGDLFRYLGCRYSCRKKGGKGGGGGSTRA